MAANLIWSWYRLDANYTRIGDPTKVIDGPGTYSLADDRLASPETVLCFVRRGGDQSVDPVGTVAKLGLRTADGIAPVDVSGASATFASIGVNGQDVFPVEFKPRGNICLTVSNYVAPLVVEVAHA